MTLQPFAAALQVVSRLIFTTLLLAIGGAGLGAAPITFPSGFVPLSSIEYTSAPDANGVTLILGYSTFSAFATIRSLPAPSSDADQFADSAIELAPGQFFSNVYIPTLAERDGDFRDFGGPIFDPLSGQDFQQNIIPTAVLGGIYAFRIGPAAGPVPEPAVLYTCALGTAAVALRRLLRKRSMA